MQPIDSSRLVAALGVRPARVAVLVPKIGHWSHLTMFEAALAAQARVWGGHGNLVFPLTSDLRERQIFWEIAERFDPDVFVVYSPTYEDAHEIDARWYGEFTTKKHAEFTAELGQAAADDLMQQLESRRVFEGAFEPGWTDPIRRRLAPFHDAEQEHWYVRSTSGSEPPPYPLMDATEFIDLPTTIVNRRTTGILGRLLLTANLGRLTRATSSALSDRDVSVQELGPTSQLGWARVAAEGKLPSDAATPWAIAENGTAQYQRQPFATTSALVVGDTAWDFALYYALKRMTGQAWWLPSWLRRNQAYMWRLEHSLEYGPPSQGRTLTITSASSRSAAAQVAEGLRRMDGKRLVAEVADWADALPDTPARVFERDGQGRGESLQLVDGQTLPLETPLPRRVRTVPDTGMRWITEVTSPEWTPVRHPRLATEILRTRLNAADQVRTSRDGMAYQCPNALIFGGESLADNVVRPTLRPLSLLSQVEVIARSAGWRVEQSDKGAYAVESSRLFGGTSGLVATLRDPELREIFETYIKKGEALGKRLSQDSRRYLSWKNMEDLVGLEAAERSVPKLLRAGVLERGVILKCERCRQRAWYHPEMLSDEFRCNRCRLSQPLEEHWVEGNEPAWFYRLAEVLFQFLRANGDVPMLAVHDAFRGTGPLAQAYELDLFPSDGPKLELDIFVTEGSRLWIGEANTTGTFAEERLELVRDVALAFGVHGVILATSRARWPDGTRAAASKVFDSVSQLQLRMPNHIERRRAPATDDHE